MSDDTTTTPEAQSHVTAAFIVGFDTLGNPFLETDISMINAPVQRAATLLEVRRYLQEILADLNAKATAEYVVAISQGQSQPGA